MNDILNREDEDKNADKVGGGQKVRVDDIVQYFRTLGYQNTNNNDRKKDGPKNVSSMKCIQRSGTPEILKGKLKPSYGHQNQAAKNDLRSVSYGKTISRNEGGINHKAVLKGSGYKCK